MTTGSKGDSRLITSKSLSKESAANGIRNKLFWTVSGKVVAELRYYRDNADLPMMGLTSTQIQGPVRASDTGIGKNYLTQDELTALKLIVELFLSFAEAQARTKVLLVVEIIVSIIIIVVASAVNTPLIALGAVIYFYNYLFVFYYDVNKNPGSIADLPGFGPLMPSINAADMRISWRAL